MKAEIITVKVTDDDDNDYRISTEDGDGDPLEDGYFQITDNDSDTCILTLPVLRALVRAAEAAESGVLID